MKFCFKDREVAVNHEEYCLFSQMLEFTVQGASTWGS